MLFYPVEINSKWIDEFVVIKFEKYIFLILFIFNYNNHFIGKLTKLSINTNVIETNNILGR